MIGTINTACKILPTLVSKVIKFEQKVKWWLLVAGRGGIRKLIIRLKFQFKMKKSLRSVSQINVIYLILCFFIMIQNEK